MRKNLVVDLMIAVLRAVLRRLERWRMERLCVGSILTPDDAFDYADRMIDEWEWEREDESNEVITAPMEDDVPCRSERDLS